MSLILLIDDEPRMAKLVEMTLADFGVRVVVAANLAEASAAARDQRPDLVLLDLSLGPEDGLGILPHLRTQSNLASTPVIVFSVHDSRRDEAEEFGIQGFVVKPFKSAQLRSVVEPWLRGTGRDA